MAAAPAAPRKGLELPKVESHYERCPDFAPGASTAGKWTVVAITGQKTGGTSFFFKYDGAPIKVKASTVLFGSFDINEWQGKDTYSCKLSGTSIIPSTVPEGVRKEILESLARIKADQVVFREVVTKYLTAHPELLDVDEEGKPVMPKLNLLLRNKTSKPSQQKKSVDQAPFYCVTSTLQTDRAEKEARKQNVLTTIFLGRTRQEHMTRGSLYELIKGKRFIQIIDGEFSAYMLPKGAFYMQLRAACVVLARIPGSGEIPQEEVAKYASTTMSLLEGLGVKLDGDFDEEAPASGTPAPSGATPAGAAPTGAAPLSPDEYKEVSEDD